MKPIRHHTIALAMTLSSAYAQDMQRSFDAFLQKYETFAVREIRTRRFTQREMRGWLNAYVESGLVSAREVGRSFEGRPLTLYRFGNGPTTVLLWSQMHGDEPTATMAIVDILSYVRKYADDSRVGAIRENLSVYVLPMINPDGAERFTRRTAQNVDMNRDALRLATPEARTLKRVRDELNPAFAFNLHDQDPRYTVGTTRKLTAVALLAPAFDEERSDNKVRIRAKKLASLIAEALSTAAPGHIAKWDDTFEPRAFGDNVQRWGSSTVLIESGGWKNDPNKMFLRRLNAAAIYASFVAISDGSVDKAETESYESLPFNMRLGFDLLLANCTAKNSDGQEYRVDVGLNSEEKQDKTSGAVLRRWVVEDVGDLHTYTAYKEMDMGGVPIDSSLLVLEAEFSHETLKSLIPLNQE